ncbi:ABC transporter ATP-binding protein/permease [Funiculus sociatus GB2-A5]|uniref:ABC transporter ATP-binding protein/permease n=1 Tax=Funiculus sociatus GB2-A5 TaxID=2933946 RepID=A0ABV0JPC0_9CYAN|nr:MULTISPECIES: ABC transporter ATP-binding protein [unclassified Trichocoleus]MBD1907537.1 ABC transporter ATP-binding protein [Trichocoleus sp. FACHB-832]MBD2062127.1 ABC transporter ATP-binding protein [Trichocoleus sp. FACHB-6]
MSSSKLLLKFARRYPAWIVLTIILGFSGGLFNGVSTALIAPIILNFLGQQIDLKSGPPILKFIMSPFDGVPSDYRLIVMAAAIVAIIVLKNLATYGSSLVSSSLSRALTSDLREAGVQMLLEVDLDFYSQAKVGDLINRLGGEVSRAATAISTALKMVITVITVLVFVALLLAISWQLTLASTVLLAVVAVVNQYSISRAKYFGKQLSEMSKSYSISVLEALSGIRLVKATGNEAREYQRIHELIRAREKADFQSQANSAAIGPVSEVTGIVGLIAIVFLGRTFFADEIESLSAVLLTYLLLLFRLLPFITQLNSARGALANSAASVEIANDFLRRDNKPFMGNGSVTYKPLQEGIHFNQISFGYPSQADMVLKDVDLYLPKGTTLALVGSSGAGKSTLADLLPRFYDPTIGSINIDGTDLREFDVKTLRREMGIVSQDTFLFNTTVRNNIAYARPDATDEEVTAAAKRANAYEFIMGLPKGFDTLIGDRGVLLSGGQRQRLAIARALVQDPDILILDEATSALDTVSERLVQAAIEELSRSRTTLVIAHRLSTVQKANQIAVLDKGRVVEVGTHRELLSKGGFYARLYEMQFSQQPQGISTYHEEIRNRLSYEARTRLNSIIGSLRLLADELVDTPEEQNELLEESYSSAISILNTIEFFENSANLPLK